jgi:hypothetical protein
MINEVPFCLLYIQSPREIKRITINVENNVTSGTTMFFFLQDTVIQSSGLSSTLKEVKGAKRLVIISLVIFALYKNLE